MTYPDNATRGRTEAPPAGIPDRPGAGPHRLPARAFLPFLAGAVVLAFSYGASFLLPDALRAAGLPPAAAGTMIGAGTASTLVGSLVAGRLAQRFGLMPTVVGAAVVLGLAQACFSEVGPVGAWTGTLGGGLLGLGWAVAYILMPVQVIQRLGPERRLEALMLLSASQMVGIGLSAPVGRAAAGWIGGVGGVFALNALLCGAAAALLAASARAFRALDGAPLRTEALSVAGALTLLRTRAALPVAMIGLAACSFSGLSTFQSLLAQAHGVPPEAFFLVFTSTAVALRFSAASRVGRLPLGRLACGLAAAMLAGLLGLLFARGLAAWLAATALFSVGYGLIYATLNALAVRLAEQRALPVPVASQVFTLGYFVGLFGFPAVAGRVIERAGADAILVVLAAVTAVAVAVSLALVPRAAAPGRPAGGG